MYLEFRICIRNAKIVFRIPNTVFEISKSKFQILIFDLGGGFRLS